MLFPKCQVNSRAEKLAEKHQLTGSIGRNPVEKALASPSSYLVALALEQAKGLSCSTCSIRPIRQSVETPENIMAVSFESEFGAGVIAGVGSVGLAFAHVESPKNRLFVAVAVVTLLSGLVGFYMLKAGFNGDDDF